MIKYPNMRKELLFNIRMLADVDFQRRVWIMQEEPKHKWHYNLNLVVEFLFEHMRLNTHLDQAIGIMLRNETEAKAIEAVMLVLKPMLDIIGSHGPIEPHIDSAGWQQVIQASRNAYHVLTEGKDPDGLFQDIVEGKHF